MTSFFSNLKSLLSLRLNKVNDIFDLGTNHAAGLLHLDVVVDSSNVNT